TDLPERCGESRRSAHDDPEHRRRHRRGKRKDPPRTRQSLVTLAAFPPWGNWPGCRHAESRPRVYPTLGTHSDDRPDTLTTMTPQPRPLADWRYEGALRTYQSEVLARIPVSPADAAMHIV